MQASSATIGSSELERQLEAQRPALTGYCYRMLASPFEAEDAVQETLLRAWRGFERFEGRAALRSWLYHRDQRLPRYARGAIAPGASDGPRTFPVSRCSEPQHASRGDVDRADSRQPRRSRG